MRIAVVARYFPPNTGGVEQVAFNLADYLAKRGHEIQVFTTDKPAGERMMRMNGVVSRRYPYRKLLNEPVYKFGPDMAAFRPDVIHDHYPNPYGYWQSYKLSRRENIPLVATYHAPAGSSKLVRIMSGIFDSTLFFRTAKNIAHVTYTFQGLGPELANSSVVPNGVDTRQFRPSGVERDLDLLFIGRLTALKRVDWMVRAAAELHLSLGVVGDGPELPGLQALAKQLNANATFFGRKPNNETPAYYSRAKLFCLASTSEGFPLSAIEAWSCGCNVISTPVGAMPEIIPKENLFSDYAQMKRVIANAVDKKPAPLPERFDLDNVHKEYERILSNAAGR